MSEDQSPFQDSANEKPAPSLGHQAADGFVWLTAQTLVIKAATTLGQIVLTWLLLPQDFGLIGLAYTIVAFVGQIQQGGIKDILIRRHRQFNRWVTGAFWLGLAAGILAGACMVAMAPLGGIIYKDSRIVGLIAILALAVPINSLTIVPAAQLQIQLRFRAIAILGAVDGIGNILLTIFFAWCGFGAYSFALPRPILAAIQAGLSWLIAGHRLHSTFQFKRWRYLLADSGVLSLGGLFHAMMAQEDYFVLGLFYPKAVVGIYYFAFNLSLQTLALFTGSLANVVLPAFSKLQDDPQRQVDAFLRATRILAFITIPLCFLQAALAAPLLHLFFHPRWAPAVPVLQILSIGMAISTVAGPSHSLFPAQGRYKAFLVYNAVYALIYLIFVTVGVLLGAAVSVAFFAAACLALCEPVRIYVAMMPARRTWRDVASIYAAPIILSAIAIGAGMGMNLGLAQLPGLDPRVHDIIAIVSTSSISGAIYLLLMYRFCPDIWNEVIHRARALMSRRRHKASSPAR